MNFLCLFLSLATGTPWIEYYFVALATVHFVLIWVSLAIARVIGTLVGWEKPDKKEHREAGGDAKDRDTRSTRDRRVSMKNERSQQAPD